MPKGIAAAFAKAVEQQSPKPPLNHKWVADDSYKVFTCQSPEGVQFAVVLKPVPDRGARRRRRKDFKRRWAAYR